MRSVCRNVSSRPTGLFADFVQQTLIADLFQLPLPSWFFSVCFRSHLSAVLKLLLSLATSAISGPDNFNKSSTYTFCSWDNVIMRKRNSCSPNNSCKCTESHFTLSTNTYKEWTHYVFWNNHFLASFLLEMNVGGFLNIKINRAILADTIRFMRHVCFASR